MTRPVPESRDASHCELECVETAMDGYTQAAAEAVADHGDTITDTHPHTLAAAYMQGAAMLHAAEVISRAMQSLAQAVGSLSGAVKRSGDAVAGALAGDLTDAIGILSDELTSPLEAIAGQAAHVNDERQRQETIRELMATGAMLEKRQLP